MQKQKLGTYTMHKVQLKDVAFRRKGLLLNRTYLSTS